MTIQNLAELAKAPRLVLKVGSSLLVEKGQPRQAWLASLAQDIAALRAQGSQVVVVSSGAIALGAARLRFERGGRGSLADAQAAASVGQIALAGLWSQALGSHGLVAAQMLLTLEDLEDRRRYLNASATFERLLEADAVPVVNENDSVATAEIRFGDNDRLAARVAQAAAANAVMLLSDVDGLYDRDPRQPGAVLVPRVEGVSDAVMAMASAASSSGLGSGGMTSKLQAAQIAERAGIALAIVNGTHENPISSALASGKGTVFVPQRSATSRKSWIGGRLSPSGVLSVDAGCASALRSPRWPWTHSIPGRTGCLRRVSARISTPRLWASSRSARPTKPVAPVTASVTTAPAGRGGSPRRGAHSRAAAPALPACSP